MKSCWSDGGCISLIYPIITITGNGNLEEDTEIRDPDAKKLNNGKVDTTSVCAGTEI